MRAEFVTASSAGLPAEAPARPSFVNGFARAVVRSLKFGLTLAAAAADYARVMCFSGQPDRLHRRARWQHRWSGALARVVGLRVQSRGTAPRSGMIVSNHLSYLDIIAFSALAPCIFVAKKEVAGWPVLGIFARMAGTIFVDRTRRMEVAETNATILAAIKGGALLVLFAEGTSSGGQTVLPFRSPLLEPVLKAGAGMTPPAIRYDLQDGSVPDEVCFWGEMTLLPHLLNFFSKRAVDGRISFGAAEREPLPGSRKDAALRLQNAVAALHRASASAPV